MFADPRGSIVLVSDSSGNMIARNTYDEYGVPGGSNEGRFQYTGQIWLPDLGMYHYKARIYAPTLGRFLQTDPIGYEDQWNLYAYVGNDPVNGSDPSGEYTFCTGSRLCGGDPGGNAQGLLAASSSARGPSSNGTRINPLPSGKVNVLYQSDGDGAKRAMDAAKALFCAGMLYVGCPDRIDKKPGDPHQTRSPVAPEQPLPEQQKPKTKLDPPKSKFTPRQTRPNGPPAISQRQLPTARAVGAGAAGRFAAGATIGEVLLYAPLVFTLGLSGDTPVQRDQDADGAQN